MLIRDIPLSQRPRERLKELGIKTLSQAELLAIVLQKGTHKKNVIDMSNELLNKYSLNELNSLTLKELTSVKGIGEAKAMQIQACFELSKRINTNEKKYLNNPSDVYTRMRWMNSLKQEHFVVILLDTKNNVIKEETLFIGTLDSSVIHPREIFKLAVKWSAHSFIIVHNHPSGSIEPSSEDLQVTELIDKLSKQIGIPMKDHLIIGDGYWSWKNEN